MRKLLLLGTTVLVLAAPTVACTGGGDDDDDDDGGTPATVSGTVTLNGSSGEGPAVGATVSVAGDASNSTTTGSGGSFTITIDADEPTFLRATGAGMYGSQRGIIAPPAGLTDVHLSGPTAALVDDVEAALGSTIDDTKGILSINFSGAAVTTAGGIAATITLDADGSFTFNSAGNPTISTTTLPNGETNLIFMNVTPGSSTVSIDLPGAGTCVASYGLTSFRVDAGVITEASYECD